MNTISRKWLKVSKLQVSSLCKWPVPLTNLINSPEASSLHRSIRLEFDPESIAGRSDCRHECIMTDSSNERRHLTVTISNLVIEKRKVLDHKSAGIWHPDKTVTSQELPHNKRSSCSTYLWERHRAITVTGASTGLMRAQRNNQMMSTEDTNTCCCHRTLGLNDLLYEPQFYHYLGLCFQKWHL